MCSLTLPIHAHVTKSHLRVTSMGTRPCVCPSEEFCGDEQPKSLILQKPKPESPRLMCWLQKLDHTLQTACRSFNQPCLSLWVLVYATKGQMHRSGFKNMTNDWCTLWGGENMPACSVFKETNHRMVEQCRMRWTCVREEDRNESRKKRRQMRWDEMRNQRSDASYSPRFFSFLSSTQCRSKLCTINKLTQSLKHRCLYKAQIKAKRGVWSPWCYFWFRLRTTGRVHLRSVSLIEMQP